MVGVPTGLEVNIDVGRLDAGRAEGTVPAGEESGREDLGAALGAELLGVASVLLVGAVVRGEAAGLEGDASDGARDLCRQNILLADNAETSESIHLVQWSSGILERAG